MRLQRVLVMCVVLCVCLPFSAVADEQAYNMTGRLGIGANLSLSGGMGLSGRYWINDTIAVEGIFNFTSIDVDAEGDTGDSQYFVLAGRGMYNMLDYGNIHGCVGAGLAFGSMEASGNDENFFGIEGFFQVEYMLNEYFAVSGQTGLSYINADDVSILSFGTPSFVGMFGFHMYL
ncbi:hypothetical protein JXQ70_04070 [bacterium]|nr:hypothetical protein [bacterium]